MAAKKLTEKQQRFVEQYLIDFNAKQAYIRAGYKARDHSAESAAERLLRNVEIKKAIAAGRKEQAEVTKWDAARITLRLGEEANFRGKGSSHAARIRALELIGKRHKYFPAEKIEYIMKKLSDMTDGELDEFYAGLSGRTNPQGDGGGDCPPPAESNGQATAH